MVQYISAPSSFLWNARCVMILGEISLAYMPKIMYNKFCAFFVATHGPSEEMVTLFCCV